MILRGVLLVLGVFFGLVGVIGGVGLGYYLGGIFGNKVGKWVDEFRMVDLLIMFKELVKGVLKINFVIGILYCLGKKVYSVG